MSKLNPLKTKHELAVSIDDIEYPFTFKPLNTKDQKELDAFRISQRANYELYDEKRAEQKELLEIKSLNEEILKDDSFTEKAKILFEQNFYAFAKCRNAFCKKLASRIKTGIAEIFCALQQYVPEFPFLHGRQH